MRVLFIGSPRALNKFGAEYRSVYDAVKKLGHTHLSDDMISETPEEFYSEEYEVVQKQYQALVDNLRQADVVVAETSYNSLAVGYIIEKALGMGKPVVVLHLPDYEPHFFSGIVDDRLQVLDYTADTALKTLKLAFDYAGEQQDVRFNFFVSPKHQNFLDWVSKTKKIPRAVFLRRLIEEDMEENEEYTR